MVSVMLSVSRSLTQSQTCRVRIDEEEQQKAADVDDKNKPRLSRRFIHRWLQISRLEYMQVTYMHL